MSESVKNHIVRRDGPCVNCQKDCDHDDWCFGCRNFVCAGCAKNDVPLGTHSHEQHWEDPLNT